MLLVFVFTATGPVHIENGNHAHAAGAAFLSSEIAVSSHDANSAPCCPEHREQTADAMCSPGSGCAFCIPVALAAAVTAQSDGIAMDASVEGARLSREPSPQFRPPRLS
jgi:hypothetical protein